MALTKPQESTLCLRTLLTQCAALSEKACGVITDVQQRREAGGTFSKLEMKDLTDPKTYLTEADECAQRIIIRGLRQHFGPSLVVVGEEEEEDELDEDVAKGEHSTDADTDAVTQAAVPDTCGAGGGLLDAAAYHIPPELVSLVLRDVCVFIDPVDGTKEYVDGRLNAVQNLIGVAYRGRAVAGVVGLPFPDAETRHCFETVGVSKGSLPDEGSPLILCGVTGSKSGVRAVGRRGVQYRLARSPSAVHSRSDSLVLAVSADLSRGSGAPALESTREAVIRAAVSCGLEVEYLYAGACGNKILKVLTGQADAVLLNLKTSKWDTCATEALLRCGICAEGVGAGALQEDAAMLTLLGWNVDHSPIFDSAGDASKLTKDKDLYLNRFGIIAAAPSFIRKLKTRSLREFVLSEVAHASAVTELVSKRCGFCPSPEALHAEAEGPLKRRAAEPHALDVARSLETSEPFTVQELNRACFPLEPPCIVGYSAPASEAFRYKQSFGCRLHFVFAPAGADTLREPRSAFCKRIVFREMPYAMQKLTKAPFKLRRDVLANLNEVLVLKSPMLRELDSSSGSTSLSLPLAYVCQRKTYGDAGTCASAAGATVEGDADAHDAVDCQFSLLLKDFAPSLGWRQSPFLGRTNMLATLSALAKWHAHFWLAFEPPRPSAARELAEGLWQKAGYWDLGKQPSDQLERLEPAWQGVRVELGVGGGDVESFGQRLSRAAMKLDAETHGAHVRKQAVLHGDMKPGNVFFRSTATGGLPRVGLIDFQWSGSGLCATDVAYCFAASISPDLVTEKPEDVGATDLIDSFLRHYHEQLLCELGHRHGASGYHVPAFDEFRRQFLVAFCDYCRVTIADHWGPAFKVATLRQREADPSKVMLYNACNKSERVARWLVTCGARYLAELIATGF